MVPSTATSQFRVNPERRGNDIIPCSAMCRNSLDTTIHNAPLTPLNAGSRAGRCDDDEESCPVTHFSLDTLIPTGSIRHIGPASAVKARPTRTSHPCRPRFAVRAARGGSRGEPRWPLDLP